MQIPQTLFLTVGLIFAPFAALIAYVISYAEYVRHYPEKRTPMLLAFRSAIVTLVVFVALSFIAGWIVPTMITQSS